MGCFEVGFCFSAFAHSDRRPLKPIYGRTRVISSDLFSVVIEIRAVESPKPGDLLKNPQTGSGRQPSYPELARQREAAASAFHPRIISSLAYLGTAIIPGHATRVNRSPRRAEIRDRRALPLQQALGHEASRGAPSLKLSHSNRGGLPAERTAEFGGIRRMLTTRPQAFKRGWYVALRWQCLSVPCGEG